VSTIEGAALPVDDSGAVLRMTESSPITADTHIDGWTTSLVQGRDFLIASGGNVPGQPAVLAGSIDAAERALDVVCYRGGPALGLSHSYDEHIVWWATDKGPHFVATATFFFRTTGGGGRLTVRDKYGRIVPPPTPRPPQWDESLRHFRSSQRAESLGESYRSLWLAVESLLDVLLPAVGAGNEAAWVQDAFAEAMRRGVQIDSRIHARISGRDPVDRAYKYFYDERRNVLFHSKRSRGQMPVASEAAYRDLRDAQVALTQIYAALGALLTAESRRAGGMTLHGFDSLADGILNSGPRMHLFQELPNVDDLPRDAETLAVWSGAARAPATLRWPGLVTYVARMREHRPRAFRVIALTTDGPLHLSGDLAGLLDVSYAVQTDLRLRVNLGAMYGRDRFPE
jgi:hypothetical protein